MTNPHGAQFKVEPVPILSNDTVFAIISQFVRLQNSDVISLVALVRAVERATIEAKESA